MRSTARGARLSRWRSAEAVRVTCAACGRPLGSLEPSVEGQIAWEGSQLAAPPDLTDRTGGLIPRMIDQSRRGHRCRCGATPVYRQATLAARYQAARRSGARHISL